MSDQLHLFDEHRDDTQRPIKLGHSSIEYKNASSILTQTSGFMSAYDYSLNPYSGCAFGCTYCYAAFFSRDSNKRNNWGKWVEAKENALSLLMKKRRKSLNDKTIYLSSVTDPYQPIERKLELTRDILKELATYHPNVRLVVQTRSALVKRDIDLYKEFEHLQINMTVTTDNEEIRKVFEPYCPSNKDRLKAIQEIKKEGIRTCITMTPLLPIENAIEFGKILKSCEADHYIIQPFHQDRGKFVAGTREEARALLEKFNWSDREYNRVKSVIKEYIPTLSEGQEGFAPI